MPIIQQGEPFKIIESESWADYKFDYRYPEGLDITPGSDIHSKIVTEVMSRAQSSYNVMSTRHDSWEAIDKNLTAFISPGSISAAKKDAKRNVKVIVPLTYATLETLLTYMVTAFLSGDAIFNYEGVEDSDVLGGLLLTKIVALDCLHSKVGLNLHTQWRDSWAYGFGAVTPTWVREKGFKTTIDKSSPLYNIAGMEIEGSGTRRRELTTLFEGNALENINPYTYLPDTNVAIHEVQKREYEGWVDRDNFMSLLDRERWSEGDLFNIKYLRSKILSGKSCIFEQARTQREKTMYDKFKGSDTGGVGITTPIDIIHMYINIIPSDWKLSDSEYPEKWLFEVAADQVVVSAKPLGLDHNRIPTAVCAPDYDGYSVAPISKLEVVYGLQDVADNLFSLHIANVKKAINDMFVVDPSLINIHDLESPSPGKLIRLRSKAWGRGVKDAVMQLSVTDVTKSNIEDVAYITEYIEKATGAVSSLQGMRRKTSERVSATEHRDVRLGAVARLERAAKVVGMQSMWDIAYLFASHTQQLMSKAKYIPTIGDYESRLRDEYKIQGNRYKVKPEDILIDYDINIKDSSMPGEEDPNSWVQMYQIMATNPQLSARFDMVRVFKHIARLLGAKNINEFQMRTDQISPQVGEEGAIGEDVRKGNLIPIEETV